MGKHTKGDKVARSRVVRSHRDPAQKGWCGVIALGLFLLATSPFVAAGLAIAHWA